MYGIYGHWIVNKNNQQQGVHLPFRILIRVIQLKDLFSEISPFIKFWPHFDKKIPSFFIKITLFFKATCKYIKWLGAFLSTMSHSSRENMERVSFTNWLIWVLTKNFYWLFAWVNSHPINMSNLLAISVDDIKLKDQYIMNCEYNSNRRDLPRLWRTACLRSAWNLSSSSSSAFNCLNVLVPLSPTSGLTNFNPWSY